MNLNNYQILFYLVDETYDDTFDYSGSNDICYINHHKEFLESEIINKGAKLINNGSLVVYGHIGGKITTTVKGTSLTINNNKSKVIKVLSLTYSGSLKEKMSLLAGKTTATTKIEEYYLINENGEVIENGTYMSDESFSFIPK